MKKKKITPRTLSANRRDFFRKIFVKSLDQVETAGRAAVQRVEELLDPTSPLTPITPDNPTDSQESTPMRWLRPPGAIAESLFVQACEACGQCVQACPAHCIQIDTQTNAPLASGRPYIQTRQSPCVVCDDLACTHACPSGALLPLEKADQIAMGTARVDHDLCLRSQPGDQQACRLCVNQCPIGETALTLNATDQIQVQPQCIGCGVCEWVCPTYPAAIVVDPPPQASS